MKNEKESWFSGRMYDLLISPLLKSLRRAVVISIPNSVNIVEIGCGTGELAKDLRSKINKSYLGVDLSEQMIIRARRKKIGDNFEFINKDFLQLEVDMKYDYAIFPMIIHSIDKQLATQLIKKASAIAKYIIIADYQTPQPNNYKGWIVAIIEKLAGKEHYSNFKEFKKIQGVEFYKKEMELNENKKINLDVFQVVKLNLN